MNGIARSKRGKRMSAIDGCLLATGLKGVGRGFKISVAGKVNKKSKGRQRVITSIRLASWIYGQGDQRSMERTIYNDQIKSNQIVINSFPTLLIAATLPTYPQCRRRQKARISPSLCSPTRDSLPLTPPQILRIYGQGFTLTLRSPDKGRLPLTLP